MYKPSEQILNKTKDNVTKEVISDCKKADYILEQWKKIVVCDFRTRCRYDDKRESLIDILSKYNLELPNKIT